MYWTAFFIVSAVCLLISFIAAFLCGKGKYRSDRILDASKILFAGVMLSAVILFIPVYLSVFQESECGVLETVLIAIHNMIRLFVVDGEFDFITSNINEVPVWLFKSYTILFAILYVLAPVLTFSFVLSFFKNVSAYKRYITHYNSNVFIFSELNEKSLTLAKSLYENDPKNRFFVFTDVFEKHEEGIYEMVEKTKEIGAICFKKDISTVNFAFHSKKSVLSFFVMGEDQSENISQTFVLIEKFKNRENTNLYVFSTQVESEFLFSNAFNALGKEAQEKKDKIKLKIRRVNEVQSLISRNLYEVGFEKIFESAYHDTDGVKKINAVVVGMGKHGTEMTKALSWFCQMDGYHVEINSFDIDKKAGDRFASICPELMDTKFNGVFDVDGETKYKITVHSDIDVDTKTFDDAIISLPRTTYIFVAMGDDEKNIAAAVKLRSIFSRVGYDPVIQAVVYNTDRKEALVGITNFKKQEYKIDFIGDLKSSYSESVILGSDIEKAALKCHLRWGNEDEFWQYDYNYKSSIASAIHRSMKILCGISGADKNPEERTEEELWALRKLEHCRWNAYMRSEGYCFAEKRNDLAKTHHCLIPFDELLEEEQIKDDD